MILRWIILERWKGKKKRKVRENITISLEVNKKIREFKIRERMLKMCG